MRGNEAPEVRYERLRPADLEKRISRMPAAYLPLGTLEYHGPHLPLGADGLQASELFVMLARRIGGVVLPMLFLGPDMRTKNGNEEFYGMDILSFPEEQPRRLPGSAYWISDSLMTALLEGVLRNLRRIGVRIVVAHGHGPSTRLFRSMREQWEEETGLLLEDLWGAEIDEQNGFMVDHGAANETSISLALLSEYTDIAALPPEGTVTGIAGADPSRHASPRRGADLVARCLDDAERRILARMHDET